MVENKTGFLITARDETREAFRSVEAGLGRVSAAMGGMLAPLAALSSVAGFGSLISSQVALGDQLSKTSQKLGILVEDLSGYQFAANLSDVSNEALEKGLFNLGKSIAESVSNPSSDAAKAFTNLGISADDLRNKKLSEIFESVAPKLANITNETVRLQYETALLGKTGYQLQPLLSSLGDLTKQAKETGNIVSAEFANKSEQFNDSMKRMEIASGKLARTVSGPLITALGALMERFNVVIGAQASLTLDTLSKDRAALAREYSQLTIAGLSIQSARAQYLIKQIDEVDSKIIEANKKMAEVKIVNPVTPPAIGAGDKEAEQTAKYMAELQKQVIALNESIAPQDEALSMKLTNQQLLIEDSYMRDLISLQTFEEMKAGIEQQYTLKRQKASDAARAKEYGSQFAWQDQVNNLMQGSFNEQLQGTGIMLGKLSQLMSSSKKKEFEAGKKAAIGEALIATYLGASKAIGQGGFIGMFMAAIVIAAGMANVNRIRSQKFGGGGGASPTFNANPGTGLPEPPSAGGSSLVAPTLPQAAQANTQPRNVNITLIGEGPLSAEWVRDQLIPTINEAVGDGVHLRATT